MYENSWFYTNNLLYLENDAKQKCSSNLPDFLMSDDFKWPLLSSVLVAYVAW